MCLNMAHSRTQHTIQQHTTLTQEHSTLDLTLPILDLTELDSFHTFHSPLARSRSTHIRFIHAHCWVYRFISLHDNPELHSCYLWAHTVSLSHFTLSGSLFFPSPRMYTFFPQGKIPTSQDVNWGLTYRYHWVFSLHQCHPNTHRKHIHVPQGIIFHNSELYLSQGPRNH